MYGPLSGFFAALVVCASLWAARVTCFHTGFEFCSTHSPSQEELKGIQAELQPYIESYNRSRTRRGLRTDEDAPRVLVDNTIISVYFHVITSSSGQGQAEDSAISQQIAVLNSDFGSTGFQFSLQGKTYTVSDSDTEAQCKEALRKGGSTDLNIYTCGNQNVLGWSTLAYGYSGDPKRDGVVLNYQTLPSGSASPYNRGWDFCTHSKVAAQVSALMLEISAQTLQQKHRQLQVARLAETLVLRTQVPEANETDEICTNDHAILSRQ
eukprot:gene28625-34555_t